MSPAFLGALLVVAVVAVLLVMLASPAQARAEVEYRSLTGADRYQTAIKVSQAGFAPGVEGVVIASGENYQGALCSSSLAAAYGGPVLLTGSTIFGDTTKAEVERLAPGKIFLVDVSTLVIDTVTAAFPDLASAGGIVVIAGADAYDTARLVAEEVLAKLGSVTGAVLVPGDKFPDAIAVAPLAAVKGWPILLTPALGPLPEATSQAFTTLGVTSILEAGSYVDPGIEGATIARFAGIDRYDTARMVANYGEALGLSYAHSGFVTGDNFPDALAAGPFLGADAGMVLLVQQYGVPAVTSTLITEHEDQFESIDFIGLPTGTGNVVKLLLGTTGLPAGFSFPTLSWGSRGAEVAWLEQRLVDLSFRPGPVDGVFDVKTYHAVIAFQKWESLSRTGTVGRSTWERLILTTRPTPTRSLTGTWIEVNKTKQVFLFCKDGYVDRTLPTSTGSAAYWVTPSGEYWIRSENTWETVRYKPLYFNVGYVWAIHGYTSVPTYPASHGCVRITTWDMDELHALVPVGTKVIIY